MCSCQKMMVRDKCCTTQMTPLIVIIIIANAGNPWPMPNRIVYWIRWSSNNVICVKKVIEATRWFWDFEIIKNVIIISSTFSVLIEWLVYKQCFLYLPSLILLFQQSRVCFNKMNCGSFFNRARILWNLPCGVQVTWARIFKSKKQKRTSMLIFFTLQHSVTRWFR